MATRPLSPLSANGFLTDESQCRRRRRRRCPFPTPFIPWHSAIGSNDLSFLGGLLPPSLSPFAGLAAASLPSSLARFAIRKREEEEDRVGGLPFPLRLRQIITFAYTPSPSLLPLSLSPLQTIAASPLSLHAPALPSLPRCLSSPPATLAWRGRADNGLCQGRVVECRGRGCGC